MKLATTFAGLTLAIAAACSIPAVAQTLHANASQANARCFASGPVSAAQLWARPLAIDNVGTSDAWITCGFEFDAGNAIDFSALMVDAYFTNNGDADATVSCAGVTGWQGGDTENVDFDIVVPPNNTSEEGNLYWLDTDFEGGGMETGLVAINCRLPAGVGINDTYVWWATE